MEVGPQNEQERVLLTSIRAAAPEWPPEATDCWLFEIAKGKDKGWPPNQNWYYVLGRRSFDQWLLVHWERRSLPLTRDIFSDMANRQISGIIGAMAGETNIYSNLYRSKERFQAQLGYVVHNGTYPRAPILMPSGGHFDIVDGNHRLAAYFTAEHYHKTGVLTEKAPRLLGIHDVLVAVQPPGWGLLGD
jgi:hypothetical protein